MPLTKVDTGCLAKTVWKNTILLSNKQKETTAMKGLLLKLLLVIMVVSLGCQKQNNGYEGITRELADSLIAVCNALKVTNPNFIPINKTDLYGKDLCQIKELYGEPLKFRVDTFLYSEPRNFWDEFENISDLDEYYDNIEYDTTLVHIPYIEIGYYEWVMKDLQKLMLYCVKVQGSSCEVPIYGAIYTFGRIFIPYDYMPERKMTFKEVVALKGKPIKSVADTFCYGKLKDWGVAFSEVDGIRTLYDTPEMVVRYYEWPVDSNKVLRLYFEDKNPVDSSAKPIWGMSAIEDYYYRE